MMYISLVNKGEERETTIGGRIIKVKAGKNWLPKGTAEFITSKIPFTNTEGISIECDDDGTPIDEIQQGIKYIITKEDIKENNLEGVVEVGEEVILGPVVDEKDVTSILSEEAIDVKDISETVIIPPKAPVTEEDKKNYKAELETKSREELISILDFKEIKFNKNDTDKKLIQTIIKSLK